MIINKTETFAKLIVLTCILLNTNWRWMLVCIVYIAYLPNGKFNDTLYLSSLIKLKINESGVNMYACITHITDSTHRATLYYIVYYTMYSDTF